MTRDPHEQELLDHYRRHSTEQPSAQLDARILAAARAAAQEKQPRLAQRLHRWLLGAGSRQRWGVAVAGLATLGIGLSLTLRTYEEAPQRFDAAPAPAMLRAPAPAPAMAPPAAPIAAEPAMAAPSLQQAPSGALMDEAAKPALSSKKLAAEVSPSREEAKARAQAKARAAAEASAQSGVQVQGQIQAFAEEPAEAAEPRASLLLLRDLQQSGKAEEAGRVRDSLQQRFPTLNIDQALKELPDNP
ncbi:hypothetical protein QO207_25570 [Pseudomonas sp. CAN2814]|uniref:hypothetical protein n=1 Tax=Pseudomonas sp. CAN1 TaxID=3046726 RepID=UPI0026490E65|nr:hypothetical protein [Pseudomonas sp. CAN1]MDN6859972.1 hypothetical protein [Pseudomonas sp. CAN1]